MLRSGLRCPRDPEPPQHAHADRGAGPATGGGARPDVHLRPDRVPVRPRWEPALVPVCRRPSAGPPLSRARGVPRQEHHGRRAPSRRAVRSRRGPDARVCRPRRPIDRRDRRRLRGGLPRRRGAREHPARARVPPSDRAHPRDAGPRRGAGGCGARVRVTRWQRVLLGVVVPRLWSAIRQLARRPARRSPRRRGAGQARPGGLRALEACRRGTGPEVADRALGRGLSRLAPGMLRDGATLPGRSLRPAYRRHRQRLPAPRGRDRAVRAAASAARPPRSGSTASTC